MTRITDFKAAAGQQLTLGDFYAILEAEDAGAGEDPVTIIEAEKAEPVEALGAVEDAGRLAVYECEVVNACHAGHGINGGGAFPYVCGFRIVGTTWGCPRRRRMQGYEKP